jgi:hypothetical protein
MVAGMILLGSIVFRIANFRLNTIVLGISLFVYIAIALGLLISNNQDVQEFVANVINNFTYDLTYEDNIVILKILELLWPSLLL